jgi:anti-sigma factor RsiW
MDHAEAAGLIALYADGELDALSAQKLEAHLETCAECKAKLETLKANRAVLGKALDLGLAPGALRNRIARTTSGSGRAGFAPLGFEAQRLAAAVLLTAILSVGATSALMRHDSANLAANDLLDAHARALEPGRLYDVASSDKHTVKPWLDARLDFAPPVEDFAAQGFPLLGGRVDHVNGRRAAVLVYGRRKHLIDVFVEPSGGLKPADIRRRGLTVLSWRSGGFDWQAVSDLDPRELAELKKLIADVGRAPA